MSEAVLDTETAAAAGEKGAGGLLAGPGDRFAGSDPAWFAARRAGAWEKFLSLPMPSRTDEAWRFSDRKALSLDGLQPAPALADSAEAGMIECSAPAGETAGRMVFANDRLVFSSGTGTGPGGLRFLPFAQALDELPDLMRERFMAQEAILGSAKFAALHAAWVRAGSVIYVPPGVEVAAPVEVFHWVSGAGAAIFPHTLVVLGENSRLTLVEEFRSSGDAASFSAGVTDLHLGDGAKLLYVSVQDLSPASTSIQVQSAVVGRDASAMSLGVHLGSRFARSESLSRLLGEGGRSDMLAVTVADGEQQFDQRTLQDHRVARTASDLLYKNALDDKARAIFSGLIKVEEGAHFTDAYQKVRNLLLSDEAEANSMPGLEINADQVRCTHGATSGQIEPEELFYLRSRGLREKDAQRLIVLGFLQEAADRIGDAALAARIGDLVRDRFGRTHPE